ncbi:Retrotransposon Pao, partial [Trinorchestia longiramus]
LLPTLTLPVSKGKSKVNVRFLVDCGSQRSYISSRVVNQMDPTLELQTKRFVVRSFLDTGARNFAEISLAVNILSGGKILQAPLLVDEKFDMRIFVPSLSQALTNVSNKHELADFSCSLNDKCDEIVLDGILGIDLLQYMPNMSFVPCMNGTAMLYGGKLMPVGNVEHFLAPRQAHEMYREMRKEELERRSLVNYVLEPSPCCSDCIDTVLSYSNVERNLEKLLSVESVGLPDEEVSEADKQKLKQFEEGIVFKDGKYAVWFVWNDNIHEVDNNFTVARAVLFKVIERLRKADLFEPYDKVFRKQLESRIIEKIPVGDVSSKVFIPHREVVKNDPACMTPVRVVLNCSLKRGKKPSLNEAAFAGVNLMSDLFELLIGVRKDKILMLSDVEKAFLQIQFAEESDKNKFCVLWVEDDNIVCYRYRTVVFGFIASPFVLNYVVRKHVSSYPDDDCNFFLLNCMYVDNLFVTGSSPKEMEEIYLTARSRMNDGGFNLRSWLSNNEQLQERFRTDETIAENCEEVKVLGYKYDRHLDTLRVAVEYDSAECEVITKRKVLSGFARCYDPMGLVLPVTVRAKSLLRNIWKLKVGWDEQLPTELTDSWRALVTDLSQISTLKFPRQCYASNEDLKFFVFTDASKTNYGFCTYVASESCPRPSLLFSKSKIAPLKSKSLPTLELLAVFLAVK